MQVEVSQEDINLAFARRGDLDEYVTRRCVIAQALTRTNPGKDVKVFITTATINGERYHLPAVARHVTQMSSLEWEFLAPFTFEMEKLDDDNPLLGWL